MTAVNQDPGDKIGDAIPDRRDHVGRRSDADREFERVGVVEEKEEHDALPEEVEREVAEREGHQLQFLAWGHQSLTAPPVDKSKAGVERFIPGRARSTGSNRNYPAPTHHWSPGRD